MQGESLCSGSPLSGRLPPSYGKEQRYASYWNAFLSTGLSKEIFVEMWKIRNLKFDRFEAHSHRSKTILARCQYDVVINGQGRVDS